MTLKELFLKEKMHFVLFGGKGGVGKTSCAAASAIWAANNLNKKVLVISTDPAHSLGDSLGQTLQPGEVTRINTEENLWGLEIDPKLEQSYMSGALNMLPEGGLPFGNEMKDLTMDLNPPGMDEAMAFGKVLEYIDDSDYDLVIFDTAPTGHTLRLLSIPEMLDGFFGKIISMRLKFGKLLEGFKGMFSKSKGEDDGNLSENPLELIEKLKKSVQAAKEILVDPEKTSFVICTISEVMSIYETERLIGSLMEYEIPSDNIIINQLYPEHLDCDFCTLRRKMQQKHLGEIRDLYKDEFNLTEVPLFDGEVRKIEGLKKLGGILFD